MLTHGYADLDGVRLHYVTAGQGKLIMFVHGFPEFWYAWKNQLAEFGQDYQAVALDMRGYNLSSKPADVEQYRGKYLIEDLRGLAEHLGHQTFTLVGHDWGGAVAWSFAATLPQYLDKLIIINAPHPAIFARELYENPAQQQASQYMLLLRSPRAEQILAKNNYARLVNLMLGWGLKNGPLTEEDLQAYLEAWSQPGALTGGLNYYRASPLYPREKNDQQKADAIRRSTDTLIVNVPTLVIWGEQDTALLTGNLDGLEHFVPNLTIKRVPDGSHRVVHEYPALVNRYIREFIEDSKA